MTKSVVVTGVSGFIGKRIAKEMLDAGYRVRGTVRSDAKAEETRLALAPSDNDSLTFVNLDLLSGEGWTEALQGADYLIHSASPFPMAQPKNPDDLIKPAVEGTKRALEAATAAGIKRVVVTSSCVAIYNDELGPDQKHYDETNWSPTGVDYTSAYDDSKTLAEKFAWDYVEKVDPDMVLSTVNPGAVFGVPVDRNYGTSLQLVERLIEGKDPVLPDLLIPVVGVEDVAKMHRLALETPEAAGQRLPACAGALTMIEMAEILNDELPDSKASTRKAPSFLVRAMAKVMSDMKTIAPRLGKNGTVSSAHSEKILGLTLIPAEETLRASAKFIASQS